jgi:hypothetical protein
MALTKEQQAAYDAIVAQGRQEYADQFAAAMRAVNEGTPVAQATQQAFATPAQSPAVSFTPGVAGMSMSQKADEYNRLLGQGLTDAQIRAAADATFGAQSATDWAALQNAAKTPPPTPPAAQDPIEQLYQQYAGRSADPEGLAYWTEKFGPSVDPTETLEFQRAIAQARGQGTEPGFTPQAWDYEGYLSTLRSPNADYSAALGALGSQDPLSALNAQTIYDQIRQQQSAGTQSAWSSGDLANTDAAAADFALRLTEAGLSSLYDLGERRVEREVEGESGPIKVTDFEYYNKATGEPLKDWGRLWRSGPLDLEYRFDFQDGTPIPYTAKEKSDWVQLRDDFVRPALSLGAAFIPGVGPYVAAANAVYSASKGEWDKAILSALGAAAPIAGQMGATASTVSNIADVNKYAKILKALDDKDLLSAAFQGADLAGLKDVSGFPTEDIKKAVAIGKAIQSENPMAVLAAVAKTAGTSGKPTSLVGGSIEDIEMIPGYFDPGGAGWDNVDWSGYANLTPEELAAMYSEDPDLGELVITAPRPKPEPDWSGYADLTPEDLAALYPDEPDLGELVITAPRPEPEPDLGEMVITAPRPEPPELDLGVDLDSDEWLVRPSPIDIPSVGAPPAAPPPSSKPPAAPPPSASKPVDISQLLALLYSQEAPYTAYVPENAADIELMEEIFGTSLSAPSTGKKTELAAELARLLRS